MVASRYHSLNGLRRLSAKACRQKMLDCLAFVATQPVVNDATGVPKIAAPGTIDIAAFELVEIGLVERAILPDENVPNNPNNIKVEGEYEYQMSPALTLICVTSILPWIEGIHNASDHFEALVAVLLVVLRYAQTNTLYEIGQLIEAVPYLGNEEHLYHKPDAQIHNQCFINGPHAPYCDLILAGVSSSRERTEKTDLAKALANCHGVSNFPTVPLLAQCKLTAQEHANCLWKDEYGKVGFFYDEDSGEYSSPPEPPNNETSTFKKQYKSGRWLTKGYVAEEGDESSVGFVFATNKLFKVGKRKDADKTVFIEGDRDNEYAWQKLYPMIHLVRSDESQADRSGVKREKCPPPSP